MRLLKLPHRSKWGAVEPPARWMGGFVKLLLRKTTVQTSNNTLIERRLYVGVLCVLVAACGGGSGSSSELVAAEDEASALEQAEHRRRTGTTPTRQQPNAPATTYTYTAAPAAARPAPAPAEPAPAPAAPERAPDPAPEAAPAPAPTVEATALPPRTMPTSTAPAPAPAPAPTTNAGAAPAATPAAGSSALPYVDTSKIPAPSAGTFSTDRVKVASQPPPVPTDNGAFRINCSYSHMAFDDPIVWPGQPGKSHLHTFFGNTAVNASTTAANITTSGNSTCAGGTIDRSGYWIASMIDTTNGTPLAPFDSIFYYKLGYMSVKPAQVQNYPAGLRIIAGDASLSGPQPDPYTLIYRWHCYNNDGSRTQYGFTIPNCTQGGALGLEMVFPQCWDGVNLDSPDHKSHMAYGNHAFNGCPSSHPVALPELSLGIFWKIPAGGNTAKWRLASDAYDAARPAGYSTHADFFNGWQPQAANAFVANCIRASLDCHANLLGNGSELF